MSLLTAIVQEALIASLVTGKMRPRPNRAALCLKVLSAVLACAGIFLVLLSANRFLEARFSSDLATLLTAICAFTLAILAAFIASHLNRSKSMDKKDLEKYFHKLAKDLQKEFSQPIEKNPKAAVLLAAAAGFILSRLKS